jgi:hypothetical protein
LGQIFGPPMGDNERAAAVCLMECFLGKAGLQRK